MIIYGASGHGKVIHDILISENYVEEIIFVDDADKGTTFFNRPLFKPNEINLIDKLLIIAIGNNITRKKVAERYHKFGMAIHLNSTIAPSVQINEGTVVMPNVCVNADSYIGKHVILNTSSSIDHDCEIGNFVHISPNACLAGNVKVGEGTHIGLGASIIQGIKIGKFATIGAGSVVIRDVPDGATVVGVPAKIIKT